MLSERLDEIGRYHSRSRAGSECASRDPSPFRPESPFFEDNECERGGEVKENATVNLAELNSYHHRWLHEIRRPPSPAAGTSDQDYPDLHTQIGGEYIGPL